jgi:hypothetical protein
MSELVVIPVTGEALDVARASTADLARAFQTMVDLEKDFRSVKRTISDQVAERLDYIGKRSGDVDGVHVEVTAPTEKQWNIDELRGTLAELVAEGTIDEAKAIDCLRYKPEVVWAEVKTLLSDPRCKARIEHCFTEVGATRYLKVKVK